MSISSVKPVKFILNSIEDTNDFCFDFMGQVTQVDETTVLCRSLASIEAAKRIGTRLPEDN